MSAGLLACFKKKIQHKANLRNVEVSGRMNEARINKKRDNLEKKSCDNSLFITTSSDINWYFSAVNSNILTGWEMD